MSSVTAPKLDFIAQRFAGMTQSVALDWQFVFVLCFVALFAWMMDNSLLEMAITQPPSRRHYLQNIGFIDYSYAMPSPGNKH
jgi:hypothetical protein